MFKRFQSSPKLLHSTNIVWKCTPLHRECFSSPVQFPTVQKCSRIVSG